MEFVRAFSQLGKNDVSLAGGKGASLGEMTRAGILIPPGFVVLSAAFDRFLEETGLLADIESALHAVNHREMHTIENASEKIQSLILGEEMPKDIARQILNNFKKLNTQFVAVRSSATVEDSSTAAWAGQLESYLNTTEKKLLENVKKCWASLFTPRAIFYRFEKNLHKQKISVAVVVQKMVDSESSGIAFSVHPVTQDRNQLIIEAGFGLGEAIVGGTITPDSYVVEKKGWRILEKTVSIQKKMLVRSPSGGNRWVNVPEKKGRKQVLSDKEIIELSKLVIKIENHYHFPVDVEFAREDGKFSIVQSRPITTIREINIESQTAKRIIREYKIKPPFIHKGFHARFYPIDFVQMIWNRWGEYAGFFYRLHISALHNNYWDLYYIPEEFTALRKHYLKHILLGKHYSDWKSSCRRLDERVALLDRAFCSGTFSKILKSYKRFVEEYLFEYALSAPIQEACGFQPEQWILPKIEEYAKRYRLDYQKTMAILTSPVKRSFITQEEIELLKIALEYKVGKNESVLNNRLQSHQRKWFWMQNNYADIRILGVDFFRKRLHKLMKTREIRGRLDELMEAPENAKQQKLSIMKKHPPSKDLRYFLEVNEKFAEMQDVRKSFVLRANHYHKLFLEAAGKMYRQPIDDLWYYSYGELMRACKGRNFLPQEEIEKRKMMIVSVQGKKEKVILSGDEAQAFYEQLQEEVSSSGTITGLVAQSGKVTGRVKLILKTHDMIGLAEGNILVSSMTRPEMTAAMEKAAAFVTDEGGITSHAAILAREMKKPCIIGTKIATKVLKDGDLVEVDANRGIVRILKK